MKFSRAKLMFGLTLAIFSLDACTGNENKNTIVSNANRTADRAVEIKISDDADELGKIIKLPVAPEEATYSANDKKLVAVLKFSAENASQIAANAEKYKPSVPLGVDAEDWFPPELVAKSQATGDASLKGLEYAANDFLQSPYTSGKLTRVNDTNYFVLELFTF